MIRDPPSPTLTDTPFPTRRSSDLVVVLCLRYIIENLGEQEILAIDAEGDVANCAITDYRFDAKAGKLVLQSYNVTAPMEEEATPDTKEIGRASCRERVCQCV